MNKTTKINRFKSLATRILIIFIVGATMPLAAFGIFEVITNYSTQSTQVRNLQREAAKNAAVTIDAYLAQLENEMAMAAQMWVRRGGESGETLLTELLAYEIGFNTLTLIDKTGQEFAKVSRYTLVTPGDLGNRADSAEFLTAQQGERYLGSVSISQYGEPLVPLAIPVKDQSGNVVGVLTAEVSLKYMWDIIGQLEVGPASYAYVVDDQGTLIAFQDPSRVLQQQTLKEIEGVHQALQGQAVTNSYTGLEGQDVIGNYKALRQADWFVLVETLSEEALADVYWTMLVNSAIIVATLVLAIPLGWYMTRLIVKPLKRLQEGAAIIGSGNLAHRIDIRTQDEVASLAAAFNGMTIQLQQTLEGLEQQVADRTHRLEIVANLGERLNAILDPADLLRECVDQVKQKFDYYHTHIYLMDEARQNLVVAAGAGQAGQEMVAKGHTIPLQAVKSLVAQTARSKAMVTVDDVQTDPEWLPNPLLPETRSEMAVPIVREGEILGVLDVQADRVAGLDESDASLLRSLANQVAVALSNARLFEQTTRSKEEAEQAKKEIEVANQTLAAQMWQTSGQAHLNDTMRGEQDIVTLAGNVIRQLCQYLNAQVGALYVLEDHTLELASSYAYTPSKTQARQFRLGEGLAGQAALEKQPLLVAEVPGEAFNLTTSLGQIVPRHILAAPFAYNGQVAGVIELGALAEFSTTQMEFLHKALESIAVTFTTAQARRRVNELLEETQQQAAELQAQEEELRAANEELENQAESLRTSEARLRTNQAELEQVNAELEEKAHALQEQQVVLDRQNRELKTAQEELEQKAEELALASKYKSEFLANMSHELRTPLNSLLILASMLAKNEDGNLTADQVESMQIIHNGGTDLLNLINDILDLSKIEAGKIEFHFAPMALARLTSTMQAQFSHVADSRGLAFEINLAEDVPETIETDQQRLEQIIKNLLSNAFKFTHQGSVRLDICRPEAGVDLSKSGLEPGRAIAIRVSDTGIGMTPEQQKIVFEAFQQADSSTSRQYGGTGLGLSISRELVAKLGGQIDLVSEKDRGSAFTLYLPIERPGDGAGEQGSRGAGERGSRGAGEQGSRGANPPTLPTSQPSNLPTLQPSNPPPSTLADDQDEVQPGDRVLLIIEDDPHFAKVVADYAHKKGFKCLLAGDGETGLALARTYPTDAIILDLELPGMNGWEVLTALKDNPNTRHIPVHIMSAADEDLDAYKRGAMGFLTKPIDQSGLEESFQKLEGFVAREIKSLLLVEDDANLRKSVHKLLEGNDVTITEADLGQTALEQLAAQHFDCMILDLSLPDMSGFELLNRLDGDDNLAKCPVIVYTGKALSEEENRELLKYADSVIVKGVKSPERLLDETALFLHRVIANLPEEKQQTIKRLHNSEATLIGKNILVVDDDTRNAFALSKLLSGKGLKVYIAPGGQKALEVLDRNPIDLVLMDIMMPGMDGYETTRHIRAQHKFHTLPVLALTAKAMKGDREKCIEAGANDYLSKPIDSDRLLSMLRVWLSRE